MLNQHVEELAAADQERFTRVVAAFEAAWERHLKDGGPPPQIPELLPAEEPLRSAVAVELALIDLERRLKAVRMSASSITSDLQNAVAHHCLGKAYAAKSNHALAQLGHARAVQLDPDIDKKAGQP